MELSNKIKNLIQKGQYKGTRHFYTRQRERAVKYVDVKKALLDGEVIEKTEKYGNKEHYLLYCTEGKKIFHIAVAYENGMLVLVTIYIPDSDHFENDNKTRKPGKPKQK